MKIPILDDDADELYCNLINLCEEIKTVLGPQGLDATLRRHKKIREFLLSYQSDSLVYFEGRLADSHLDKKSK